MAARYHLHYQRHDEMGEDCPVAHSVNLYLIDASGNLAMLTHYGFPAEHILRAVSEVLCGL